jgi:hypothetical protein
MAVLSLEKITTCSVSDSPEFEVCTLKPVAPSMLDTSIGDAP